MERPRVEVLNLILGALDPVNLVSPSVRLRTLQADEKLTKRYAVVHFLIWPALFVMFYFTNDQAKTPLEIWRTYRFGLAGLLCLTGIAAYFFRNSVRTVKICLGLASLEIAAGVIWSMHFGYPIQLKWPIWLPTLILTAATRSLILQCAGATGFVFLTIEFGILSASAAWIKSDLAIAFVFLLVVHLMRIVWIRSKESEYQLDDVRKELDEQKMIYDRQIRSLISPVLMKKVDASLSEGKNLIYALDDVLKRTKRQASVLYTDIRRFSERSAKQDFVEQELIPSSSFIIDVCEANMGVAKQIGDAVIVFYSFDDPEESLLRAVTSAIECAQFEETRIKNLGRSELERFFTVTFGDAYVGNMASIKHREPTIIGDPPNLANRIDSLTKESKFMEKLGEKRFLLMSKKAAELFKTFAPIWNMEAIDLDHMGLSIKSYPNERSVYVLYIDGHNLAQLDKINNLNGISRPIKKVA